MIRSATITIVWIAGGASLVAAAFAALLLTPEATVWSLAASALLVLIGLWTVAVTVTAAVLASAGPGWSIAAIRLAARRVLHAAPPFVFTIVAAWAGTGAIEWMGRHSGGISAWFLVTLGWDDVRPMLMASRWTIEWLRWVVAPLMALVWLRHILTVGWPASRSLLRDMLSIRRLVLASAAFALLIWIPWIYLVPWRPASLPVSAEMPFVVAKLAIVWVVMAAGAAGIIMASASPHLAPRRPGRHRTREAGASTPVRFSEREG